MYTIVLNLRKHFETWKWYYVSAEVNFSKFAFQPSAGNALYMCISRERRPNQRSLFPSNYYSWVKRVEFVFEYYYIFLQNSPELFPANFFVHKTDLLTGRSWDLWGLNQTFESPNLWRLPRFLIETSYR